jgi:general secretion pathway protein C
MIMRAHALALVIGCLALARPAAASDLRLTGVLVSGPASVAIIAGADGREKVYRLGNEILPGATLEEVSAHGIMLLRDRRREWLPLVGGSGAPVAPAPQPLQVPQKRPETSAGMAMGGEPRSKFNAELAKQGSTTPAPGGGVQLNEVTPDGAYAAIGLRPGDVLRSVNGNPVDSAKDLNALARQVASGASGQVQVVRDGEVSVLHFGQAQ